MSPTACQNIKSIALKNYMMLYEGPKENEIDVQIEVVFMYNNHAIIQSNIMMNLTKSSFSY